MITTFTPIEALLGGSLIGIAAVALMVFHGRIAGMTGIVAGAMFQKGQRDWRIAFLLGAIAAPMLIMLLTGNAVPVQTDIPSWAIIVGGLLVGVGVMAELQLPPLMLKL